MGKDLELMATFVKDVGVPTSITLFILVIVMLLLILGIKGFPAWASYLRMQKEADKRKAHAAEVMAETLRGIQALQGDIMKDQRDILHILPTFCRVPASFVCQFKVPQSPTGGHFVEETTTNSHVTP